MSACSVQGVVTHCAMCCDNATTRARKQDTDDTTHASGAGADADADTNEDAGEDAGEDANKDAGAGEGEEAGAGEDAPPPCKKSRKFVVRVCANGKSGCARGDSPHRLCAFVQF